MAVIQVSSLCGYTVIFQVKTRTGCEASVTPRALKELIENDKVQLVRTAMTTLQIYIRSRYVIRYTCRRYPPVVLRP